MVNIDDDDADNDDNDDDASHRTYWTTAMTDFNSVVTVKVMSCETQT